MKPNQAGKKPLLSTCFKLLMFVFMLPAALAIGGAVFLKLLGSAQSRSRRETYTQVEAPRTGALLLP